MELNDNVKKAGDFFEREELPERDYNCIKHGPYRGFPFKFKWSEKEFEPACPICLEEFEKIQKEAHESKNKSMEAEEERNRIRWLTDLNIGKRLWNESFETFNAYTDELKHHLEICKEFANDPQGRKLIMLGNNGTGKNHLAASILKITGGVIHKLYEVNLMLKQSYFGDFNEWEILCRLCNAEMLVIDEIGRTKGGEWEENWLSYVIDKRHENLMPIILISNKHLKEDCPTGEGCQDCLQNWVGNDILSRIIEDGLVMEFTGEDYRHIKRSQGGD